MDYNEEVYECTEASEGHTGFSKKKNCPEKENLVMITFQVKSHAFFPFKVLYDVPVSNLFWKYPPTLVLYAGSNE